eukprot:jgi/Orpsp1_1/1182890/evm.model.c7180000083092.1
MNATDLDNKELNSHLENEISIFDGDHCLTKESCFTITENQENKDYFSIEGENESFKGTYKNLTITLSNPDDVTVFYLKTNQSKYINEIYVNEEQTNIISEISYSDSETKKVSFLNLAKEKDEYFEMVRDSSHQICDIFYGDQEKEAPVICKIKKTSELCNVRIAPGVDYIFILGLAAYFFRKDIYIVESDESDSEDNSRGYDSIAQLNMPSPYSKTKTNNKFKKNKKKKDDDDDDFGDVLLIKQIEKKKKKKKLGIDSD